ncbi:MAG TPA: PilN domain-containing protein [Vicinamibacterales bacterium]|jgi:Tfp pilus assembly protein PilN|nr:PilN domain-containing protein [Vicinamibacterales bacterium]
MIRGNLATRPFYNERAIRLWLLIAAVVVGAATIFNVTRILRYSRSDTQLATSASRDESRAADLRQQAAQLRARVDPRQVEFASAEAREANALIDRRTFSWTELFNRFETTLPDEVRITAVRPKLDRDKGIVLQINVVARDFEDVRQFMENLEKTDAFGELRASEDRVNEQGLLDTSLDCVYVPGSGRAVKKEPGGRR